MGFLTIFTHGRSKTMHVHGKRALCLHRAPYGVKIHWGSSLFSHLDGPWPCKSNGKRALWLHAPPMGRLCMSYIIHVAIWNVNFGYMRAIRPCISDGKQILFYNNRSILYRFMHVIYVCSPCLTYVMAGGWGGENNNRIRTRPHQTPPQWRLWP